MLLIMQSEPLTCNRDLNYDDRSQWTLVAYISSLSWGLARAW